MIRHNRTDITISRHSFKPHEWRCKDKAELVRNLKEYTRDYLRQPKQPWTIKAINHFLEIFNYLYPGETPKQHHIRCIATIITEGGL